MDNPKDTAASPGTPSGSTSSQNHTGQSPQLPPSLWPPGANVSGIILRAPDGKTYGTVTLTLLSQTEQVSIAYYLRDISETARQVISESLERIASALYTESGITNWTNKSVAPESHWALYPAAKAESPTGSGKASSEKLLWDDGPQEMKDS